MNIHNNLFPNEISSINSHEACCFIKEDERDVQDSRFRPIEGCAPFLSVIAIAITAIFSGVVAILIIPLAVVGFGCGLALLRIWDGSRVKEFTDKLLDEYKFLEMNTLIKAFHYIKSESRITLMKKMTLPELYLTFLASERQFKKDLSFLPENFSPEIDKMKRIATLSSAANKQEFIKKMEHWDWKEKDEIFLRIVLHQAQKIKNLSDRLLIARYCQKQMHKEIEGKNVVLKLQDNSTKKSVEISKSLLMENGSFFKALLEDAQPEDFPLKIPARNVKAAVKLCAILNEKNIKIDCDLQEILKFAHQYAEKFHEIAKMILTQKELKAISLK